MKPLVTLPAKLFSIVTLSIAITSNCDLEAKNIVSMGHESVGDNLAVWLSPSGQTVQIEEPEIVIKDWIQGPRETAQLNIDFLEKTERNDGIVLDYAVHLDATNYGISGTYSLAISYDENDPLLKYETELTFDAAVRTDVTVLNKFTVEGVSDTTMLLPERDGKLMAYQVPNGNLGAGRYELGLGAAKNMKVNEIGIPVVGLALNNEKNLAVSMDPYCGGLIQAQAANRGTEITVSTTYKGTTVPVKHEERRLVMEITENNDRIDSPESADSILMSFYKTIPEIKPGADWLDKVHLTYYDYLADNGEGWFNGLQHLADRIPEEFRDRVAVCQHGWYDYFLQYAYDKDTGKLKDEWIAFPGSRKIPMSIEDMHKRFKFAQDLGFRTFIYFADGTNSDTGFPDFHPEWVLRNAEGNSRGGWVGPDSVGRPVRSDPSVPGLQDFFKDYLRALLDEYGEVLDGFVWDETFYIPVHTVSYSQETPAYADRAMLELVSDLTQIVQEYHDVNPDLVFLTSDWGNNTNGLVAHGTWEDTVMHPERWHRSMFSNYRNTLWSNLWHPVQMHKRNGWAADLGFPQGLSNGWNDDEGPHEMPQKILNNVLDRFFENIESGQQAPVYFDRENEPVYFQSANQ